MAVHIDFGWNAKLHVFYYGSSHITNWLNDHCVDIGVATINKTKCVWNSPKWNNYIFARICFWFVTLGLSTDKTIQEVETQDCRFRLCTVWIFELFRGACLIFQNGVWFLFGWQSLQICISNFSLMCEACYSTAVGYAGGGGRKRLPKFKFSVKFPIGLHVIFQIQIKKFENDCYIMWKIILTENPSRCNLAPLLK